jgi:iron complex transport system ATP-binding protein
MVSEYLLKAEGLEFSYNGDKLIGGLEGGLDIRLQAGSLGALIGANGSGKSTLLRLLCGLQHQAAGSIRLGGDSIASISRMALARRIAYVSQNAPVIFPFSVLEVVLTGRNPHLGRFAIEDSRDLSIATDALEQVGIAHLAARAVTTLSSGERQLAFVARAIAQEPALLLLDEPSGFLDLLHRAQLVRTLRALCDTRGIAALVVTHDLMLLEPSFDQVFALLKGRINASGPPSKVLQPEILKQTYNVTIHTLHEEGKIFVWSEV